MLPNSYTDCRIDTFEGEQHRGTGDVSVKWSVLPLGSMGDPKIGCGMASGE
ncbi:hypothetical protein [Streptomyces sp. B1I3]|uniref:hypothetical protein n=1 Tax=Streptomyces sp. B1I3 TaxID=3042264 RepID=UPI00277E0CB1|nr:hypothetical protein [Streptomyces sp. B1I3]MDQ0796108.1 hypothetical protein [Streptomyces sp. B1I3]